MIHEKLLGYKHSIPMGLVVLTRNCNALDFEQTLNLNESIDKK